VTIVDLEMVRRAVHSVDDPEYPGVSIVELGLLESVEVTNRNVRVGLIPTFSGCPALETIRGDVHEAVAALDGVADVDVVFMASPVWSPARLLASARTKLADEFTVAVALPGRSVTCPLCGSATSEVSAFGPTRCRSVSKCDACGEVVEVMR